MYSIKNKYITSPQEIGGDGIGLCDGHHWTVENCIIDFSEQSLSDIDEAVGVTWGSSATFRNCVIRGAGKLVLIGCGDADRVSSEAGKLVRFENCILERFGRRGPEVQNLMVCELKRCIVRGWGNCDRFSVRSFGGWAHKGGMLHCTDVVFDQPKLRFRWFRGLRDLIGHIGQAINETGVHALFCRRTWINGRKRGLMADNGGRVSAEHCYVARKGIVIENSRNEMTKEEAAKLVHELETMAYNLRVVLGVKEWNEWDE